MGGVSFTCDARPHSPRINFLSWKPVVGSGLLVHFSAPIVELITTTSSIKTNNKTHFQRIEHVIELFMFLMVFLGTPFQKLNLPGTITVLGTLGGTHE